MFRIGYTQSRIPNKKWLITRHIVAFHDSFLQKNLVIRKKIVLLRQHASSASHEISAIRGGNLFYYIMQKLESLFCNYPNVDRAAMGFPDGWRTEPLWM